MLRTVSPIAFNCFEFLMPFTTLKQNLQALRSCLRGNSYIKILKTKDLLTIACNLIVCINLSCYS